MGSGVVCSSCPTHKGRRVRSQPLTYIQYEVKKAWGYNTSLPHAFMV